MVLIEEEIKILHVSIFIVLHIPYARGTGTLIVYAQIMRMAIFRQKNFGVHQEHTCTRIALSACANCAQTMRKLCAD